MLRFHLDEHIDSAIADGLRRRGIDVTTTAEAGLRGAGDEAHVAFALSEGRVVVTNDADFCDVIFLVCPAGDGNRLHEAWFAFGWRAAAWSDPFERLTVLPG